MIQAFYGAARQVYFPFTSGARRHGLAMGHPRFLRKRKSHLVFPAALVTYSVKEIFYTLQGEGARAGRPAVFCRFAGCNLWTGLEEDRASAVCSFCDTDFVGMDGPGGGKFETPEDLADAIAAPWPATRRTEFYSVCPGALGAEPAPARGAMEPQPVSVVDARGRSGTPSYGPGVRPFVVCTGGEPLLQLDAPLVDALHARGFEIAVETNGTRRPPPGIDWICVSPKAGADLALSSGDELKLVYPQPGAEPERYAGLGFEHFYVQPMDGPHLAENTRLALEYCLAHPQWRLSLQTHKLLGIP